MKKLIFFVLTALLLSGCVRAVPAGGTAETVQETTAPETTAVQTQPPAETEPPRDVLREKLDAMTLEEKVGQMFLGRCRWETGAEDIEAYHLGGFVLFGRDFDDQTPESLGARLDSYQNAANIPMLLAVDEEGGTVCRVSSHTAFREEKFPSPREAYASGGMEMVLAMEWEKGYLLHSLGLNVNLAPVCDISQTPGAFLYNRSLGADPVTTGQFVAGTLERLAENGIGGVMKHFPGYGDNGDTHVASIVDNRSLEALESKDLAPFAAGIQTGLGAILVSHNIVTALDPDRPASLSPAVMTYLRETMGFDRVILTDDLSMGALDGYTAQEAAVLAVQAGATMLCSTDFDIQIPAVLEAVNAGTVSEAAIDDAVMRILQWKQDLGLL